MPERKRPQLPKPPFPYEAEDVSYPSRAKEVKLAGTLTIPEGKGPFPTVVSKLAYVFGIHFSAEFMPDRPNNPREGVKYYFVQAVVHAGFAVYLLLGTRHLAGLCYDREEGVRRPKNDPLE